MSGPLGNYTHGCAASLQGSLQSLGETVELHKQRANLAERGLMERDEIIRKQASQLKTAATRLIHLRRLAVNRNRLDLGVPVWRVLDILNGAADGEG